MNNNLTKLIYTLHDFKTNNSEGIEKYYYEKITERINGCLDVQFQKAYKNDYFDIEPRISAIRFMTMIWLKIYLKTFLIQ
jgi:hypothetical protein